MPTNPLGPTGLLAQSMTLPAGSQSLAMGGMGMRAQGMDGRKTGGRPVRIFQVSPAVSGKTLWNLDADGPFIVTRTVALSPQNYTITPLTSGYLPFAFWGQGAADGASRGSTGFGGFLGGEMLVVGGQAYTLTLGRGGGSAGLGSGGGQNGSPGGGFTGLFSGAVITQAAAVAVAAGAGGDPGDGVTGADGGADTGQGQVGGYAPVEATGGSQTAGGVAATNNGESSGATAGSSLQGGKGADDTSGFMNGGGGGGGGYFGGGGGPGGGSFNGSGAGGSNFALGTTRNTVSQRGGGTASPYWTTGGVTGGNLNNAKAVFF